MQKLFFLCVFTFLNAAVSIHGQTTQSKSKKSTIEIFDFAALSKVDHNLNPEINIERQSLQNIKGLLIRMFQADQQFRDSLYNGSKEDKKQQYYLHKIWNIDIVNQKLLDKIVKIHGWPTPNKFDEQSTEIAWYIVWHGQIDYKKKYLNILKKASDAREINSNYYHSLRKKLADQ